MKIKSKLEIADFVANRYSGTSGKLAKIETEMNFEWIDKKELKEWLKNKTNTKSASEEIGIVLFYEEKMEEIKCKPLFSEDEEKLKQFMKKAKENDEETAKLLEEAGCERSVIEELKIKGDDYDDFQESHIIIKIINTEELEELDILIQSCPKIILIIRQLLGKFSIDDMQNISSMEYGIVI